MEIRASACQQEDLEETSSGMGVCCEVLTAVGRQEAGSRRISRNTLTVGGRATGEADGLDMRD